MSKHFLHEILNPKSIAVYGANNTYGTTMGTMQLINIICSGFKGEIYPIHLKLDLVLGHRAYKTIAEVPEIPDLVIIVLPSHIVPQVFKECGEKGVKRIVLISGGFREAIGAQANNLTEEITEIANKYGIRFIGPNCFGFYNAWCYPENENGEVYNMMLFKKQKERGKFSIASQSGTMTSHIFLDPDYIDLKLGKSISIGNEANIDIVDFLEYFKDDEETEIIGLYIEEIKRGKEFIELAKKITPKKPIVAIYAGGSTASNRAIKSHTGSLSGNTRIFDAVSRETGIIQTIYINEFLNIISMLQRLKGNYPKGNRIGIITNSGGPGAMIAKNAENQGLIVPEFSKELKEKLRNKVAPTGSVNNPIDMTFDTNIYNFYVDIPKMLMISGEVDVIVIYGAIGFLEFVNRYMQEESISPYVEARKDMLAARDILHKIMIKPGVKASKENGVPIIYINPQNYISSWSQKIRKLGGIVFKLWDMPINCLAKICEYSKYLGIRSSNVSPKYNKS